MKISFPINFRSFQKTTSSLNMASVQQTQYYRCVVDIDGDQDQFIGTKDECIDFLIDTTDAFYEEGSVNIDASLDEIRSYYEENWGVNESEEDDSYGEMHEQQYVDFSALFYVYRSDKKSAEDVDNL